MLKAWREEGAVKNEGAEPLVKGGQTMTRSSAATPWSSES